MTISVDHKMGHVAFDLNHPPSGRETSIMNYELVTASVQFPKKIMFRGDRKFMETCVGPVKQKPPLVEKTYLNDKGLNSRRSNKL